MPEAGREPKPLMIPRAYDIYTYKDGVQDLWVGGAPDAVSACNMAAAYFSATQVASPRVGFGVGVYGEAELEIVAFIGWQTEEV